MFNWQIKLSKKDQNRPINTHVKTKNALKEKFTSYPTSLISSATYEYRQWRSPSGWVCLHLKRHFSHIFLQMCTEKHWILPFWLWSFALVPLKMSHHWWRMWHLPLLKISEKCTRHYQSMVKNACFQWIPNWNQARQTGGMFDLSYTLSLLLLIFLSQHDIVREKPCRWKQKLCLLKHPTAERGQKSVWTI